MLVLFKLLKFKFLTNTTKEGAAEIIVLIKISNIMINGKITIIIPTKIAMDLYLKKGSILFERGRIAYANMAPRITMLSIGVNKMADTTIKSKIIKIADVTLSLSPLIIFSH